VASAFEILATRVEGREDLEIDAGHGRLVPERHITPSASRYTETSATTQGLRFGRFLRTYSLIIP
jgi:hypothetical protein